MSKIECDCDTLQYTMTPRDILVCQIRTIFSTETFEEHHLIGDRTVDLCMPKHNIIVEYVEDMLSIEVVHGAHKYILVGRGYDICVVAGSIYFLITTYSTEIRLPPEVLVQVVLHAHVGDGSDLHTLRSLSLVSKYFNKTLRTYRSKIIDHYTMINVQSAYIAYRFCGMLHNVNDQPALWRVHCKEWFQYGYAHRDDDKPAVEYTNGRREWFRWNERHRINGPAVITADGSVEYWIDGRRYNTVLGGPAGLWLR
jgi:hypothetical protein